MAMASEQGHLAALLQDLCPPASDEGAAGDQASIQEDILTGDYASAAADIASKFDNRVQQTSDLRQQLLEAFKAARAREEQQQQEADAEFTEGWRRTGLPSKAAQLQQQAAPNLNLQQHQPQRKHSAGVRKLLDAGSILAAHQQRYRAEVLEPPVVFTYNDNARDPHYLETTANLQVRNTMLATARATSRSPPKARTKLLGATITSSTLDTSLGVTGDVEGDADAAGLTDADASGKRKQQAKRQQQQTSGSTMHAEQLEAEHKIIRKMHQRLTFKRNPRYPLPASMALLDTMALAADKPQWLGTTGRPRPSPAELAASRAAARSRQVEVFRVEPEPLVFSSYEAGYTYQQVMKFVNTTPFMAALRVLPPATSYFHVSQYMVPGSGNDIEPGMHAELVVSFTPDTRGAYSDVFTLVTPLGSQEVTLSAQRPLPVLSLPAAVDVGHVVVGGRVTREVLVTNTGGSGCFMLLPATEEGRAEAAAAALLADTSEGPLGTAQGSTAAASFHQQLQYDSQLGVGPFTVTPARFDLATGQQVMLSISFSPQEAQTALEQLVLVADNCTTRGLELVGCGSHVDVQMVALDGHPVSPDSLDTPVWFGEVVPGAQTSRTLTLCNNTAIPFAFNWQQQQQQQSQHSSTGAAPAGTSGVGAGEVGSPFTITPSSAVIHPGELLEMTVTFAPSEAAHAGVAAALVVDPYGAAGAAPAAGSSSILEGQLLDQQEEGQLQGAGQDEGTATQAAKAAGAAVQVLQLFLEGAGRSCQLQATPAAAFVLDPLEPNQEVTTSVTLSNPSAAAVSFQFESDSMTADGQEVARVGVMPAAGEVLPGGDITLQVCVTGVSPGKFQQQLVCHITHGHRLLIPVMAEVVAPVAVPSGPDLDFGLLQLGHPGDKQLVLHNPSTWSDASWELQVVDNQQEDPRPTVTLSSSSGCIAPDACCGVTVTCAADVPGTHQLLLRCTSGGQESYVRLRVTVVIPDIQISSSRVQLGTLYRGVPETRVVKLRNTCRIPIKYKWTWQQVPQAAAVQAAAAVAASKQSAAAAAAAEVSEPAEGDSGQQPGEFLEGQEGVLGTADAGAATEETQQLSESGEEAAEPPAAAATGSSAAAISIDTTPAGEDAGSKAEVSAAGPMERHASPGDAADSATRTNQQQQQQEQQELEQQEVAEDGTLDMHMSPVFGSLAAGEEIAVTIQLSPTAVGRACYAAVCSVLGMPGMKGLILEGNIEGLQLDWQVLPWKTDSPAPSAAADLSALAAGASTQDSGSSSSSDGSRAAETPAGKVVAADFGLVQLRQDAACLLLISNLTSVPAPITCWMEDEEELCSSSGEPHATAVSTAAGRCSSAATSSHTMTLTGQQQQQVRASSGSTLQGSKALSVATRSSLRTHSALGSSIRSNKQQQRPHSRPLRLKDPAATVGPFRSPAGNLMMSERLRHRAATQQLSSRAGKGWVVVMQPQQALLPAWGKLGVKLLARNDVPGDYMQHLCVQVGDLPVKRIPCRLRVVGSPLQLHKQRVLLPGSTCLRSHTPGGTPPTASSSSSSSLGAVEGCRLLLDLGQVLPQQRMTETFYVTNNGGMAMRLSWEVEKNQVTSSSSSSDSSSSSSDDTGVVPATSDTSSRSSSGGADGVDQTAAAAAAAPAGEDGTAAAAGARDAGTVAGRASGGGASAAAAEGSSSSTQQEEQQQQQQEARPPSRLKILSGPSSLLQMLGFGRKDTAEQQTEAPASTSTAAPAPAAAPAAPVAADSVVGGPSGFEVTPLTAELLPGQKAAFQVTFCTDMVGDHQLLLVGKQTLAPPEAQPVLAATNGEATGGATSSSAAAGLQQQQQVEEGQEEVQPQQKEEEEQGSNELQLQLWPTGDGAAPFQTIFKGGFHPAAAIPPVPLPLLTVQLKAALPQQALSVEQDSCSWTVESIQAPGSHPSFRRTLCLRNWQRCPLSFQLSTAGPFELLGAVPSAEQDADRYRGTKAYPERIAPGTLYLPPGAAVEASLRCWPPADLLQQQLERQGGVGDVEAAEVPGQLLVDFTCGTQQVIPLIVTQLFPRVTLSATSFAFGKVHPSNPKSLQLTITNPSTVAAQWSIQVMEVPPVDSSGEQQQRQQGGMLSASGAAASSKSKPPATSGSSGVLPPLRGAASSSGGSAANTPRQAAASVGASSSQDSYAGRTARSTKAEVASGAAPCVFSVSEASGTLPGRGLGMPYKHTVSVTFSPSSGVQSWQGLLRVAVKGGPGAEVQLVGSGDLKEPLPGLPNIRGF